MNPLVRLGELGQSPWYDYITRDLLTSEAATKGDIADLKHDIARRTRA